MPVGEDVDMFPFEKIIDVGDISSKEIKSMWMVVLNWLRNIYDIDFIIPKEHVVFT